MLEAAIRKIFRAGSGGAVVACPEAETLAAYVEKTVDLDSRRALEGHLAECDSCLDQVLLCSSAADAIPHGSTGEERPFDLVVRFLRHTVELVRWAVEIDPLPSAEPVPVRSSGPGSAALKCVRFGRTFDDLVVEVEVEATAEGLGEIRVEPSAGGAMVEDVRVTLLDDRRELDSSTTRGGSVSFDEVEFGDYVIRLSRQGRPIGEVSLCLERG